MGLAHPPRAQDCSEGPNRISSSRRTHASISRLLLPGNRGSSDVHLPMCLRLRRGGSRKRWPFYLTGPPPQAASGRSSPHPSSRPRAGARAQLAEDSIRLIVAVVQLSRFPNSSAHHFFSNEGPDHFDSAAKGLDAPPPKRFPPAIRPPSTTIAVPVTHSESSLAR